MPQNWAITHGHFFSLPVITHKCVVAAVLQTMCNFIRTDTRLYLLTCSNAVFHIQGKSYNVIFSHIPKAGLPKGSCISPCVVFGCQMCLGLLWRRRHSLLLCCYCVVATGSLKASYTIRWRAELTSSLVTASFCNYKSSMKVKAFVTSRADIKILCCSTNQLKPVQTALYTTCHYLFH